MQRGGRQQQHQDDVGEHRDDELHAGSHCAATAQDGRQPADDEISFISEKAQSNTPLEYSECSSASSQHVLPKIAPARGGVSISDSATSSEVLSVSETSERGRQRLGVGRRNEALDDALAAARGLSPASGGAGGSTSSGGGISPSGATSVLRRLRNRRAADTIDAGAAAPPTATVSPPQPLPPQPLPPQPPPQQPAPTPHRPAVPLQQPQEKRPPPPPTMMAGPLVWILNVTCCPAANGVAATDAPGVGPNAGRPAARTDTDEELVAGPAGAWTSPP
mmetsp:Transcript_40517/g.114590  ORF Transcript_40517/g.114590 Transcript_40517/m.114590 type:complete len:277 (+) Transcript_40517:115-945(+)